MGLLANAADLLLLIMVIIAALLSIRIILKPLGIDGLIEGLWKQEL